MNKSNYPKSPEKVQLSLTRLSLYYNLKATGAIFSVLLFFAFYISLILASAYLIYWAFIYEMYTVNKWTILLKFGAIAGSIMLFIFTFKFIFKLKNHPINNRIKLQKKEHAEIWEFVYQICKETGAPKPKNIYVDPDVNAYVAYSNLWLSLFFPVRKELTVGLGLVNCLNLSEFKAVISHEFGHFSQRSMTIGSYIITANNIIYDMIFSRDKWDELLAKWQSLDFRLSFAAYALLPMIWLIRQLLNLFFQLLNVLYSSLSREMEFNADKVAVKTSGSEAIISGLWKLDYGFETWNKTLNNAYLASQKQMFVKNLYIHNTNRISEISDVVKHKLKNLPNDDRGGKLFFSISENSKVGMYASHPANDKREENAKRPFIHCESDERSPWILFPNKESIQEDLSKLIYKLYWNKSPETYATEAQFEEFIREELKGESLQNEYENTFVNRFVTIPDEAILKENKENTKKEEDLKMSLTDLMEPIKILNTKIETLQAMSQGTTKIKEVKYEEMTFNKKNLDKGFNKMIDDREKILNENFKEWDKDFFSFYYVLANKQNKEAELLRLYNQHQLIVKFYRKVVNTRATIFNKLQRLQQSEEVSESHVVNFSSEIREMLNDLNKEINVFSNSNFVPLTNIANVDELKLAIIEGGRFTINEGNIFKNGGFDKVVSQLEIAPMNCQRIDQKSINTILLFHQELKSNKVST